MREALWYKIHTQPYTAHCSKELLRCWASRVQRRTGFPGNTWGMLRLYRMEMFGSGQSEWRQVRNVISHVCRWRDWLAIVWQQGLLLLPLVTPHSQPQESCLHLRGTCSTYYWERIGHYLGFGFNQQENSYFLWVARMQSMDGNN